MRTHRTAGLDQLGPRHFRSGAGYKLRYTNWPRLSEESKRRADLRYRIASMVASGRKRKPQKIMLAPINLPPLPVD
jgi:hypothetical protein